jgi:hypothetical protein
MIEAPEAPHHHHHKTGLPWFDLIVPIAVLCISIASLLTSLQSEKSMHALVDQNARLVSAQSTPLLMMDTGNFGDDGKPVLSMSISNVGTGPARIEWLRVVDDQGFDYGALYDRVKKVDPRALFTSQQISGTLMKTGDERSVFRWPEPIDNAPALAEWTKLNTTRFHLHSSACYCSIFDECKITEFGESRPKAVSSCEVK